MNKYNGYKFIDAEPLPNGNIRIILHEPVESREWREWRELPKKICIYFQPIIAPDNNGVLKI
jgi:hypothetical protein